MHAPFVGERGFDVGQHVKNNMLRSKQIDLIRAACIKANQMRYPEHWSKKTSLIRLADVLYMLMNKPANDKQMEAVMWKWKFRQDDLTEQSDECVAFLYELLK